MAQNYTLMARKNLLKPDETPKYYAVARSGRKESTYWMKEISPKWVTWAISA